MAVCKWSESVNTSSKPVNEYRISVKTGSYYAVYINSVVDKQIQRIIWILLHLTTSLYCLQCFDAVGWAAGRPSTPAYKNLVVGADVVICLEWGADWFAYWFADAIATHYLLLQQIQIGFTFLVPAHMESPGQRDIKQA